MIYKKSISLVIPCRNEAEGLASFLAKVPPYIDEVVIVDNRSTDKTRSVAKKMGARVMREDRVDAKGIGYGYALQRGIKAARGEIVVTMDGDGTYPLNQIKGAVAYLRSKKLDIVLCSRLPLDKSEAISWFRQLGINVLNLQVRLFYHFPIQDILSGMWVMKKSVLSDLSINEGGWNLSPEIKLAAINTKTLRIGQYHIHHYHRDFGKSKQQLWQTGLDHLTFIGRKWIGDKLVKISLVRWLTQFQMAIAEKLF